MKIYTEKEWFDTFYPKEWGDWTKEYNINEYRNRDKNIKSACTWMDYHLFGIPLREKDGKMKIIKRHDKNLIDHFFIECGNEKDVWLDVQPYLQIDGTYYASVLIDRLESNLELYRVYISGIDDSSFTSHCLGSIKLKDVVDRIKKYGPSFASGSFDFIYTN
jgi:hypothetical protein